jgi:hypothetical protein
MKQRLGSWFTILALGTLLAPASGAQTNLFPLMAWDYADSKETLRAMHDCGITSVAFVRPNMLDACQRNGLKAIVFDESISGTNWAKPYDGGQAQRNLPALIRKVGKHPAVLGYHLKDEPHATEFPELAKAVAAVRELAPGKWPYINLLPGTGTNYDKYVEDFITVCKPDAVSYDRYSLVKDGELGNSFWSTLAQVSTLAHQHQLPLWNIILTSPHWNYREITEADLRLQVWGSLAYGVKGLAYYKFCSKELPILDAPDLGNFRNGPLDPFGEKTQTWHWLRTVNRQVHNLAPVYLKLRSDDVYHIGDVPDRNHGPTEKSLVKNVPRGEFVVGDFTHEDGGRYSLVVNKSLSRQAQCLPEFNVAPKSLKYVSAITGEVKRYPSPYFWLAPGQGVLLKIE